MARRKATETPETTEVQSTEENTVSTDTTTEAPVEAVADAPETDAPEAPEYDLTDFQAALKQALEVRDETTGVVPEANVSEVVVAYRQIKGAAGKRAAKEIVDEAMKEAMREANLSVARANLSISEKLVAGPSGGGSSKSSTPREPVDPTEAFVELAAGLRLATTLVGNTAPEGVAEDWQEKAKEKVDDAFGDAETFLAWLQSEDEGKGDEPEVPAFVKAAVKLALGKSARVGTARARATGGGYSGERRDVAKHIQSAFADVAEGTFLAVAEIRNHKSEEYGNDAPSAGAISARLFPRNGKVTIEGVEPATQNGKKGAVKA
jgi:hypothetical protein